MPIGTKNKSFRQYEGNPLCHGCDDKFDSKCCEKQKNPDYAFEFDDYERLPEYVEKFTEKQVSNDTYLEGEYCNVNSENVYHYELTNEEINEPLQKLIDTTHHPNGDNVDMIEFHSVIVNSCFVDPFNVYDIEIKSKDFTEGNLIAKYDIFATIYRDGKSHGKRINTKLWQDIGTGDIEVKDIKVVGVIPYQDIKGLMTSPPGIDELVYNKYSFDRSVINFQPLSSDDIFQPDKTKEYICDKTSKWKQEYNVDVDCTKI
jgi:hypothetical protein